MGPTALAQQKMHKHCIRAVEVDGESDNLFAPAIGRCWGHMEGLGHTVDHDPCL